MPARNTKPVLMITGVTGNLGRAMVKAFHDDFLIVGLDRSTDDSLDIVSVEADFSSDDSLSKALCRVRKNVGKKIAAVVHLVAFFDSTGEDNPLYKTVNVDGTRRLIRGLSDFEVERFIYASTMLVHAPCEPGRKIDEKQPYGPLYIYPESKLEAEELIRKDHGDMPYAILRFAGVYDEKSVVPTLAQQNARIYERDFQSYFYSASTRVGQAMLHRDDMIEAVERTIARRNELPDAVEILIGEEEGVGYDAMQDEIGYLLHGQEDWPTLRLPKSLAAAGSWVQGKLEPVVPDALDQGEPPFIRPYMVAMSDAHYALDVSRARNLLGWSPRHRIKHVLPAIIDSLKKDPAGWYQANGMKPPPAVREAADIVDDEQQLLSDNQHVYRTEHADTRWAHFVNVGLGSWLVTQAPAIGMVEPLLRGSEIVLGLVLMLFAALALSWTMNFARWVCAGAGALIMALPFLFWTENAASYLSDTLVGGLAFGLAVGLKPEPGTSPVARMTGPAIPPGWKYNPSAWTQRVPIVVLALLGLYISRYLAGYQMGHTEHVWEPFFPGAADDPRNGTEEIITSSVSRAWPVPDAAVGAYTYALEVVTGVVGSRARWRTMPWLVVLFGLMIVPLGIVSISFIIIQPIIIGTWSTLALIGALAMLLQMPYSMDELLAVFQFLGRRKKAGKSVLRVFFFGDTDEGGKQAAVDEFDRSAARIFSESLKGGVTLSWAFLGAAAVGVWLMFTRLTLDAQGAMANTDHIVGALVLTVLSLAAAEVARPLRYLLVPLGLSLIAAAFLYDIEGLQLWASIVAGIALIVLSAPRGHIMGRYGPWDRWIF